MLEKLSKFSPQISILALILVSVFNIGYFSRIGMHFLGLMDFSNIAYSVGIAFIGLLAAFQFGVMLIFNSGSFFSDEKTARVILLVNKNFIYPVILIFLIYVVLCSTECVPSKWSVPTDRSFLAVFMALAATTAVRGIIAYHQSRKKLPDELIVWTCIVAIVATYFAGRVWAAREAFTSEVFYRITDKNGFEDVVRIVRTSSAGFLISKDGKVIFVPKEEVRRIETDFDLASEKIK